jgi:alanine dehydrogenase
MRIGIAAENREYEKRVVLRPKEIICFSGKFEVLVEKNAGIGIGIKDSEYQQAGAIVAEKNEVYQCDIVVRIKEPKEVELKLMKNGSVIFSMLHLHGNRNLRNLLKKYNLVGIPMDAIKDSFGKRRIEALYETGILGMNKGFELWGGDPLKCEIKIMGYGNVAWGAINTAARKFAKVSILNKKNIYEMEKYIPGTDILVNALKWPHENRGKIILVKKEMLKLFKKGSVILDLISNPVGQSPIESSHPTTLKDISYIVDGVIHTSCWGWPGIDPVGISKRYSIQIAPILMEIAECGILNLPKYIQKIKFNSLNS